MPFQVRLLSSALAGAGAALCACASPTAAKVSANSAPIRTPPRAPQLPKVQDACLLTGNPPNRVVGVSKSSNGPVFGFRQEQRADDYGHQRNDDRVAQSVVHVAGQCDERKRY